MADSLEEEIGQAQIAKTRAETDKLLAEADASRKAVGKGNTSEAIKILAGVVLGVGGFAAGITQYELAETRAKFAAEKFETAKQRLAKRGRCRQGQRSRGAVPSR